MEGIAKTIVSNRKKATKYRKLIVNPLKMQAATPKSTKKGTDLTSTRRGLLALLHFRRFWLENDAKLDTLSGSKKNTFWSMFFDVVSGWTSASFWVQFGCHF
jgi:hypothetical protein